MLGILTYLAYSVLVWITSLKEILSKMSLSSKLVTFTNFKWKTIMLFTGLIAWVM